MTAITFGLIGRDDHVIDTDGNARLGRFFWQSWSSFHTIQSASTILGWWPADTVTAENDFAEAVLLGQSDCLL